MRSRALAALLMAAVALPASIGPALAQQPPVENRVKKLEAEMRAVQRKVFPGAGRQAILEPEIQSAAPAAAPAGVPAGSAVADLTARIDALEAQLARLTGQAEEAGFKVRQLEAQLATLQSAAAAAPAPAPVQAVAAAEPAPAQPQMEPGPQPAVATASADPAEDAYLAGFRLWEQKKFADAHQALEAVATKYPTHRRASWARNLAGRALLDDGKPAAAAKTLFANYEADPKGERAPDSLFYLGDALTRLKKTEEACKVYLELQNVYGAELRDNLKRDLPKARKAAGCS
jgi:TolA-binding protein